MLRPEENPSLIGHHEAEQQCLTQWQQGNLPHAILISGARGIGKATFAYRLARFVLSGGAGGDALFGPSDLSVDPESSVFKRVATGAHGDLLVLTSEGDDDSTSTVIKVDQARKVAGFFAHTAAESGWRVVIIDSADDLNPNAANALLKTLEEPPANALIILVSHSPGKLLPTIRSRCRNLALQPPDLKAFEQILATGESRISMEDAQALYILSNGSAGAALHLHEQGAMRMYEALIDSFEHAPTLNTIAAEALVKLALNAKKPALWQCWRHLWDMLLHRLMLEKSAIDYPHLLPQESPILASLAKRLSIDELQTLQSQGKRWLDDTEILHLERKQVITSLLQAACSGSRL